jgi:hypothetical protein
MRIDRDQKELERRKATAWPHSTQLAVVLSRPAGIGYRPLWRGEAFKVEHLLFYSVVGLAVLVLVFVLANLSARNRLTERSQELAERAQARRQREGKGDMGKPDQLPNHKIVLRRELKNVPIPWGWPGGELRRKDSTNKALNGLGPADSTGSMKSWIEHLIAEKRTVEDDDFRSRKQAALRFMIEDRYGRSIQAAEIYFQSVKPPRLRDPDRPHDQMDNFPSGRTDAIASKLSPQPGESKVGIASQPLRKPTALGDIKRPWGW